jgi:PhnB protein
MQTKLNPYIGFIDNTREALEFYKVALGGTLELNSFKDSGMPVDEADAEKIMHGNLVSDSGLTLMAADTPTGMERIIGNNVNISLSGDNEAELTEYFNKLSEGGTVGQPLTKAPWGDTFGMFTDKFGIHWMVNISGPKPE